MEFNDRQNLKRRIGLKTTNVENCGRLYLKQCVMSIEQIAQNPRSTFEESG